MKRRNLQRYRENINNQHLAKSGKTAKQRQHGQRHLPPANGENLASKIMVSIERRKNGVKSISNGGGQQPSVYRGVAARSDIDLAAAA
jgi:hypothetical protein